VAEVEDLDFVRIYVKPENENEEKEKLSMLLKTSSRLRP
jgi:hypothetical protein